MRLIKTTIPPVIQAATARAYKPGGTDRWSKTMNDENRIENIEPSVLALGAAYAATLLGMIFWMAA
jgi:hypothetical protein